MANIGSSPVSSTQFGFLDPSPGAVIAAGAVLPFVCIFIAGIRVWVRLQTSQSTKRLGWDDWLILVSLLPICMMGIILIYGTAKQVIAYPSPDDIEIVSKFTPTPELVLNQKLEFIYILGQVVASGLVKLSILFFFRRLFLTHHKTIFNYLTLALISLVGMWTLAFTLAMILDCGSHVDVNWGSVLDKRLYCRAQFPIYYGWGISDFLIDLAVLSLPFPLIWNLRLNTRQKLQLVFVFALGYVALTSSIIRMVLYIRTFKGGYNGERPNIFLVITLEMYWSMIEIGVMWIAACLPIVYFAVFGNEGVLLGKGSHGGLENGVRDGLERREISSSEDLSDEQVYGGSGLSGTKNDRSGVRLSKDEREVSGGKHGDIEMNVYQGK